LIPELPALHELRNMRNLPKPPIVPRKSLALSVDSKSNGLAFNTVEPSTKRGLFTGFPLSFDTLLPYHIIAEAKAHPI